MSFENILDLIILGLSDKDYLRLRDLVEGGVHVCRTHAMLHTTVI